MCYDIYFKMKIGRSSYIFCTLLNLNSRDFISEACPHMVKLCIERGEFMNTFIFCWAVERNHYGPPVSFGAFFLKRLDDALDTVLHPVLQAFFFIAGLSFSSSTSVFGIFVSNV